MDELVKQLEYAKSIRDMDGIEKNMKQLYEEAKIQQNHLYMAIALYYKAFTSFVNGRYKDTLLLGMEGLTYCENHQDSPYYVQLCNVLGVFYGTQGDHINSLSYFLKAYYTSVHNQVKGLQHLFINNIGTIFQHLGFYEKALEYFLQGMDLRGLTIDNMDVNDGVYIVNVIGAYVNLRQLEDLAPWLDLYQIYSDKYDNEIVRDDYQLYQIYMANYEHDEKKIIEIVQQMIDHSDKNRDVLHIFKNLLEVLDVCLSIGNQPLCEQLRDKLLKIHSSHMDVHNEIALQERIVELSRKFYDETEQKTALLNYYESKKKGSVLQKENMKKNLLMKIELESLVNKQQEILRKNEELQRNNELDEFTRVYHKASFRTHVSHDLQNGSPDQYIAFFIIDIDNFKQVNDTYGHLAGDEVLLRLAEVLKSAIRNKEYVGRVGGDEFCIFMKNIYSHIYVEEKAEKMLKDIQNIAVEGITDPITVSIGVCVSQCPADYEKIFEIADEAMYRAKNAGRNQLRIISN